MSISNCIRKARGIIAGGHDPVDAVFLMAENGHTAEVVFELLEAEALPNYTAFNRLSQRVAAGDYAGLTTDDVAASARACLTEPQGLFAWFEQRRAPSEVLSLFDMVLLRAKALEAA